MSFIISVYTANSIVMASDSRLVYYNNTSNKKADLKTFQTDNVYKLFLCPNNAGIACIGNAVLKTSLLYDLVQKFIDDNIKTSTPLEAIPEMLVAYFGDPLDYPNIHFHVAGFIEEKAVLYRVVNASEHVERIEASIYPGAVWDGENEIASRLLKGILVVDESSINRVNKKPNEAHDKPEVTLCIDQDKTQYFPTIHIPWLLFTPEDCVAFAEKMVQTTIDFNRFSFGTKNCGGEVDVLVIQKNKSYFAKRK